MALDLKFLLYLTGNREVNQGLDDTRKHVEAVGDTADKTTQRVRKSNADLRESYRQVGQSSVLWATETDDAVAKLMDKYDQTGAKARSLKADFNTLSNAAKNGLISAADDARYDLAMSRIGTELKTAKAAAEGFGVAETTAMAAAGRETEKFTRMTTRARRELIVMGHEAMTGNWSRFPGSMMVLTEELGRNGIALGSLLVPLAAAAAAVGVLTYAVYKGEEEMAKMQRAILLTNDAAGVTVSGMENLAHSISGATGESIGSIVSMETAIAGSGKIGADAFETVTKAAAEYARVTGESAAKVGPMMVKLFEDPAKGALKLNSSMHFLTVSELAQIQTLEELGQKQAAQQVLASALQQHLAGMQPTVENLGDAFSVLGTKIANAAHEFSHWAALELGGGTKLEREYQALSELDKEINDPQYWAMKNSLIKERHALVAQITADENTAANAAAKHAVETANNIRDQRLYEQAMGLSIHAVQKYKNMMDEARDAIRQYQAVLKDPSASEAQKRDAQLKIRYAQEDIAADQKQIESSHHKTAAAKSYKTAIDTVIQSADNLIRQQGRQISQGTKLTAGQKEINKLMDAASVAMARGNYERAAELQSRAAILNIQDKEIGTRTALNKLLDEWDKSQRKAAGAEAARYKVETDSIGRTQKALEQQKEHNKLLADGITNTTQITISELRRKIALDSTDPALAHLVELEKEHLSSLQQLASSQDWATQYKADLDMLKSSWKSIDSTAHDTFVSILESGKNAFTRLRDTLKNTVYDLLYQMTIHKWIINLEASGSANSALAGLLGIRNPAAGAAVTGYSNSILAGSSGTGLFSGGLTGALGGNSVGMSINNMAPFAASDAGFVPNWQYGLSGIGGGFIGHAISGNNAGSVLGTLGGVGGEAVGTSALTSLGALAGPVGAVFGAIAGGFLGSLFGGGGGPKVGGQYVGNYDASGNLINSSTGAANIRDNISTGLAETDRKPTSAMQSTVSAIESSAAQIYGALAQKLPTMSIGMGYNEDPHGGAGNMYYANESINGKSVYSVTPTDSNPRGDASAKQKIINMSIDMLKKAVIPAFDKVSSSLGAIAKSISGSLQSVNTDLARLADIGKFMQANPISDALQQIKTAGQDAYQTWQASGATLQTALSNFDGSSHAIATLSAATTTMYTSALRLVGQIKGAETSINSTYQQQIEAIKTSQMSSQKLYDYLRGEMDAQFAKIKTTTDPAVLQQLGREISQEGQKAWGTLNSTQQASAAPDFEKYYQQVDNALQKQLDSSLQSVAQTQTDQVGQIKTAMDGAAQKMSDSADKISTAADKINTAADKPVKVEATINVRTSAANDALGYTS